MLQTYVKVKFFVLRKAIVFISLYEPQKKPKYVNLYSDEGREKIVEKLPGRHKCDCQTMKHKLVNNCINCGRIVCSQEGSGPCYFCGSLVRKIFISKTCTVRQSKLTTYLL